MVRRSHFLEDVPMQMESVQYDPTKEVKVSNHTQTPKHSRTYTHTGSNHYTAKFFCQNNNFYIIKTIETPVTLLNVEFKDIFLIISM